MANKSIHTFMNVSVNENPGARATQRVPTRRHQLFLYVPEKHYCGLSNHLDICKQDLFRLVKHLTQRKMSHPLYFTAVQLRILQALYQCSNRVICAKLFMRMVLRNAESFFQVFNRLMDISGSHTNFGDLFDNIPRKYHKLIQQLRLWSWRCSCGNGSILSQK